jgi:hypothetical protein
MHKKLFGIGLFLSIIFMFVGRSLQKNQLHQHKNQVDFYNKMTPSYDLVSFLSLNRPVIYGLPFYAHSFIFSDQHHVEKGQTSWIFHRTKFLLKIFPYFDQLYIHGALYSGIIHNDPKSGSALFKEGIEQKPGNCQIIYHATMFELSEKNNSEGLHYLKLLEENCPEYERVVFFVRQLYTKKDGSKNILKFYQHSLQNKEIKDHIDQKIKDL